MKNLLIEQFIQPGNPAFRMYRILDKDNGEMIKGVTRVNLEITPHSASFVLEGYYLPDFEGVVNLTVKNLDKKLGDNDE